MHITFALRHLTSDIVLFYPKHFMVVYNIHDGDCEAHKFVDIRAFEVICQ